jgi:hypothetical protein
MAIFRAIINRWFSKVEPLPPGIYSFKAPRDAPRQYRLHLRLEPDGKGLLLINAATVLHLNPTAAEYAYHLVQKAPGERAARQVSRRYRVRYEKAMQDYAEFREFVESLLEVPDLEPITSLEADRQEPYSAQISAPYRLDCALTYRQLEGHPGGPGSTSKELTTAEWKSILDKAWAAGIPHAIFTGGGEPTLRPDLNELLDHAEQLGMVTGLITDGQRLGDSAYLNTLLQAGLDHTVIVLEPQRDESWESLLSLTYWKDALEADLHIVAHLTINPDNASQAAALLEGLAGTGIHAVSLSASGPSLASVLSAARERAALLGLTLVWDLPVPYADLNPIALETADKRPARGAGRAWLYVQPNGDVLPSSGRDRILGNILRDPWEAIWSQAQRFSQS